MRRTNEQKIELINEILANNSFSSENMGQIPAGKSKIIHIRDTEWTNCCTNRKELVKNIYTFASEHSGYAKLINSISVDGMYNDEKLKFNIAFVKCYQHVNINCSVYSFVLFTQDLQIKVCYQSFCNPITPMHLLEDYGSDVLLATNLETQNVDDSFNDIYSVSNVCYDRRLDNFAKKGSSYIELLTNRTVHELQKAFDDGSINDLIKPLIKTKSDEVWAKHLSNSYYSKLSKDYYERNKRFYSSYYPVITYDEIQDLKLEYSSVQKNIGCFGLGSAGTAILDLIGRCNYFKTAVLVDYDVIEEKNLRNQWYTAGDVYGRKAECSKNILKRISNYRITSDIYIDKIENVLPTMKCDFKYVISGFDNLEARKYIFYQIEGGNLVANYLIDCRYLDLSCSIYFIDTTDKEQMEYYINQLKADIELFNKAKAENKDDRNIRPFEFDELMKIWRENGYFQDGCLGARAKYGCTCPTRSCSCGSDECKKTLYSSYLEKFPENKVGVAETSCVHHNFIDIYKYVGAIVMGAIRRIENKEDKPFTHVEAETNVNGLPACMVVRG